MLCIVSTCDTFKSAYFMFQNPALLLKQEMHFELCFLYGLRLLLTYHKSGMPCGEKVGLLHGSKNTGLIARRKCVCFLC